MKTSVDAEKLPLRGRLAQASSLPVGITLCTVLNLSGQSQLAGRLWNTALLAGVISVLQACGSSPTSPATPVVVDECPLLTVQCILDRASVSVSVNDAFIAMGSPTSVAAGSTYRVVVNFANPNTQALFGALWLVRDDGLERLGPCLGLAISIGGGGGFNFSSTISGTDEMFAPGHTVRMSVVGTFGQIPPPGDCPLRSATGGLNQAAVQGQRHLATFVRQ